MASDRIVGIDLGTTNSLVAFMQGESPVVIPGDDGSNLVPSVVALDAIPVAYRCIDAETMVIDGATPEWFGPFAAQHQIVLYELTRERGSLEEVFLALTHGFDAADPRQLTPGQVAVHGGGS